MTVFLYKTLCSVVGFWHILIYVMAFSALHDAPVRVDIFGATKALVIPVLKHGPRSLACAQVNGCYEIQRRSESKDLFYAG